MPRISLKAARINANMSQTEAAEIIGVTQGTLSSWETGKTSPTVEVFKRMAQLYQIPEDFIFLGEG